MHELQRLEGSLAPSQAPTPQSLPKYLFPPSTPHHLFPPLLSLLILSARVVPPRVISFPLSPLPYSFAAASC